MNVYAEAISSSHNHALFMATCLRAWVCAYARVYKKVSSCANMHVIIHSCMHALMHSYGDMSRHTSHTHTQTQPPTQNFSLTRTQSVSMSPRAALLSNDHSCAPPKKKPSESGSEEVLAACGCAQLSRVISGTQARHVQKHTISQRPKHQTC